MAKASTWNESDGEGRKRGEQNGLDTRVVHAVNVVRLLSRILREFVVTERRC